MPGMRIEQKSLGGIRVNAIKKVEARKIRKIFT